MRHFWVMLTSLFLLTGCSTAQWFSFPSKFALCDVDVFYDTKKDNKNYVIIAAVGWCSPAKFLQKKKQYND